MPAAYNITADKKIDEWQEKVISDLLSVLKQELSNNSDKVWSRKNVEGFISSKRLIMGNVSKH